MLRESAADESVDLICLDPPFNSNASYNVLFKGSGGADSQAQLEASDDTWHWTESAEQAFDEVLNSGNTDAAQMPRAMALRSGDAQAATSARSAGGCWSCSGPGSGPRIGGARRRPEAPGDGGQHQEVDLARADPPPGPVARLIPRPRQPGEPGGGRRRPAGAQPDAMEEAPRPAARWPRSTVRALTIATTISA